MNTNMILYTIYAYIYKYMFSQTKLFKRKADAVVTER